MKHLLKIPQKKTKCSVSYLEKPLKLIINDIKVKKFIGSNNIHCEIPIKNNEDMRTEIIKPILIYLLYYIIPFVILIILLNFFTTIAAVFLVFYIRK